MSSSGQRKVFLSFIVAVVLLIAGCKSKKSEKISVYENETNYSEYLKIDRQEDFIRVRIINPWDPTSLLATYILVARDSETKILPEGTVVKTPVESLVAYSSVPVHALEELGGIDVVKGVADARYMTSAYVKEGLKNGKVVDVGLPASPSKELILSVKPDGILLNLYEGMDISAVESMDVAKLKMVDNMEKTPLGRAEWIRFIGLLTGKETMADSIFNSVVKNYRSLCEDISSLSTKPKILTETPYEGTWYVSGGDSFQANLIKDAGGVYFMGDDSSTGSLFLSFEQVLEKGWDSDVWLIKVFGGELSKDRLLREDSRYTNFKPLKSGRVFFSDTSKSNLFDEVTFHPDLLLRDYAIIFHPEEFKGERLRYFTQMKR